jgi:tRNA(adenine34) deaminase
MKYTDEHFLTLALEQANKAFKLNEVPVGAVLIYNNKVIASSHNERESNNDPLGHAEIKVISEAAKKLKSWRLINSILYVTVEPCLMCAGAILQSRISKVVYGCQDKKAGAVSSLYQVLEDKRLNHRVEVTSGICEEQCRKLMQQFFKKVRTGDAPLRGTSPEIIIVERWPSG